jgi:Na+-driven multidrug efflux pump
MFALEAPLYGLLRLRIAYLQAVNRNRDMQLLSVLSILIYIVLAAAVLGAVFGAYGILAAFPVSDFLSLATVWACCSFKTRKLLPSKSECAVSGNQQRYYLFSNKGTGTEEWMKKGGAVYP